MSILSMSFYLIHVVIETAKCTCSNELALGCLKAFLHFFLESLPLTSEKLYTGGLCQVDEKNQLPFVLAIQMVW